MLPVLALLTPYHLPLAPFCSLLVGLFQALSQWRQSKKWWRDKQGLVETETSA